MEKADVIVAGGGPVGLGLAIELGQRGVRVLVLERHAGIQPIPRGQNLTQRTMEHMRAWGCEAAVRAARTIPADYGIGGLTAYGTLFGDYAYDWLPRERVRPYYATDNERLPQYATEAALRARVDGLPSVAFRTGWSVDAVAQDEHGAIVDATDRSTGRSARFTAPWVVGCDGARSAVRESAGITQTREDHDRLMVLLVFRSLQLNRMLGRYPGKSFYNVLHPELEGYWRFFGRVDLDGQFFFHAPVARSATEPGHDFVADLYRAAGAEFDVTIDHVGFWDLRFAIADRYRARRIFVAGDAAHSHPPYGGYGINTGFEDARNLGWKLAAQIAGWAGPALLDSYDAERRPVFESTARDFIAKSIADDRAFLGTYDPASDRPAFEAAWHARSSGVDQEVASFAPHYHGSPIVAGPGVPSAIGVHRYEAVAGEHLAPCQTDHDDVSGHNGSAFVALSDDTDAFTTAAADCGVPLTGVAAGAGCAERYAARHVLVRPDGFVAWAGDDVPDAAALLARAVGRDVAAV